MIRVKQTYPEVKTDLTEMNKLEEMLQKEGIEYRRIDEPGEKVTEDSYTGEFHQIRVDGSKYQWDVICYPGTYGFDKGKLEYQDNVEDDVIGGLTAEDVMQLVQTFEYRRGYRDAMRMMSNALDTAPCGIYAAKLALSEGDDTTQLHYT